MTVSYHFSIIMFLPVFVLCKTEYCYFIIRDERGLIMSCPWSNINFFPILSSNSRQTSTENKIVTFSFYPCFSFVNSAWRLSLSMADPSPSSTFFPAFPSLTCVLAFSSHFPPPSIFLSLFFCHILSSLCLSTSQSGNVDSVLVEEWETVSSFSHSVGVRKVFPDLNGTRLVFIDEKNCGFLFSPSHVSMMTWHIHACHAYSLQSACTSWLKMIFKKVNIVLIKARND